MDANAHSFLLRITRGGADELARFCDENIYKVNLWGDCTEAWTSVKGQNASLVVGQAHRPIESGIIPGKGLWVFGDYLLEKQTEFRNLDQLLESIRGQYCVVHLDDDGKITVATDLGLLPVYVFKDERGHIFSSRIDWLMSTRSTWTINWHEVVSFLHTWDNITTGSKTFIENVHTVEYCTKHSISVSGCSSSQQYWTLDFKSAPPDSYDEYFELTVQSICESLRRILEASERPVLDLTAGWDSRLTLAAFKFIGANHLETATRPHPVDLPAAVRIAASVGIRHHAVPVDMSRLYPQYRDDNLVPVFSRGTASGAYSLIRAYQETLDGYAFDANISCVHPELLKSKYSKYAWRAKEEGITPFECAGARLRRIQKQFSECKQDPVLAALGSCYDYYLANVASGCPSHLTVWEEMEWFYFANRFSKKWGPRNFIRSSLFQSVYYPFMDRDVLQNGFKIKLIANAKDRYGLQRRLISRFDERLLRYGFDEPLSPVWATEAHIYTLVPPRMYPYHGDSLLKMQLEDLSANWRRFSEEIDSSLDLLSFRSFNSFSLPKLNSFLQFCLYLKDINIAFAGSNGGHSCGRASPSYSELWHHVQARRMTWRRRLVRSLRNMGRGLLGEKTTGD